VPLVRVGIALSKLSSVSTASSGTVTFYKLWTNNRLRAETFLSAVAHIHYAIPNRKAMRKCRFYIWGAYTLIIMEWKNA
jgi:hypothetical protein